MASVHDTTASMRRKSSSKLFRFSRNYVKTSTTIKSTSASLKSSSPRSSRLGSSRRQKSQKPTGMNAALGRTLTSSSSCSSTTEDSSLNVVQWLETSCPEDVLPKVLAFAGPQKTAALSKVNRHWREILQKEATWRVLCEDLYKWKPGDKEPESWAEHYRLSPCVPTDWPSISKALDLAFTDKPSRRHRRNTIRRQIRPIRILLRPGTFYLHNSIKVESKHAVSIETIQLPQATFQPPRGHPKAQQRLIHKEAPEQPSHSSSMSRPVRSLRSLMFHCRRNSAVDETEPTDFSSDNGDIIHSNDCFWGETDSLGDFRLSRPTRATLVLRTRKPNEPALTVRQGQLRLQNINIHHHSEGLDIWNGNAAIQIQPDWEDGDPPIPRHLLPKASLDHVHITSYSGRGIVNIDGGNLRMSHCAVEDCAATGIYIGGPGSRAYVEGTDVVHNGVGQTARAGGGIARGHSGVYLEQGTATIRNCNISANTLTGISAVSPSNAILTLEECDLINNGTNQLELPPPGTVARRRSSVSRQNRMSGVGRGQSRSGLLVQVDPQS